MWSRSKRQQVPDVCLVLEGTYPYVRGGVSSWTHQLILNHPDLTFHLVTILASPYSTKKWYEIPANVLEITPIKLQELPRGRAVREGDAELLEEIQNILVKFEHSAGLEELHQLAKLIERDGGSLGSRVLLESAISWELVQRMYRKAFAGGSFLDYFWSWRCLFGGLFSVMLSPIPRARVYHSLCTGYAGLFAARASISTGSPMILSEHGLYTNERRIELGAAQWFHDVERQNLSVAPSQAELRSLWENAFASYSKICYEASSRVVSLFRENREVQAMEGADPARQRIIPNGVEIEQFSDIKRTNTPPHVVALIGRIVPIKGTKSFIQAARTIVERFPETLLLIIGPTEEDPRYVEECETLVEQFGLSESILFTGSVDIRRLLSEISILVLTSLSEAQPLVILEAGAAGIPVVATDVGSCRELLLGVPGEKPALGAGGMVARVSDSADIAEKVCALLADDELRERCGVAMKERVNTFYTSAQQHAAYRALYQELLQSSQTSPEEMVA